MYITFKLIIIFGMSDKELLEIYKYVDMRFRQTEHERFYQFKSLYSHFTALVRHVDDIACLLEELTEEVHQLNGGSESTKPKQIKSGNTLPPFKMRPITELDIYYGRGTDGSFFLPKDDEPTSEPTKSKA